MALARVVSFEGVGSERMAELAREVQEGGAPEGMPPAELTILHDPAGERALAIVLFDNEEDYRKGDEVLDAMSGEEVPGRRTGVTKYDVAVRVQS